MSTSGSTTEARPSQGPPKVEVQKEHHWLQKLVGEWTYEFNEPPAPGQPPEKVSGSEIFRSIHGVWVIGEGRGEMPGAGSVTTLMTLGFDTEKKRFVGTWVGSMMTYLWVYDGELDPAERMLTLNSIGPTMTGDGKTTKYQDVIEFTSDDHRTLTARMLGADGTWQQLMKVDYRRRT